MTSKSNNKKFTNEIPTQVSSPNNSREIKQALSFANLRFTDRFKHPQNTTPIRTRNKRLTFQLTNQKSNKQNYIRYNSPKSNNYVSTLDNAQLIREVQQLKHKISIMTQKEEIMEQNYSLIKEQKQMIKQQYCKKQEQLRKKKDKYKQYKHKSHQYDQIVPKLDELQKLQDTVIQQNQNLQRKQKLLRRALEQILNITDKSEDSFLFAQLIQEDETEVRKKINQIAKEALEN